MGGRNRTTACFLCVLLCLLALALPLCLALKPNCQTQSGDKILGAPWAYGRGRDFPRYRYNSVRGCCFLCAPRHPVPPSALLAAAAQLVAAEQQRGASPAMIKSQPAPTEAASATTATTEQGDLVTADKGPAPAVPAADADAAAWDAVPITSLRTACRKLQLPSKGKRDEILRRLQELVPVKEVVALVNAPGSALKSVQSPEGSTITPKMPLKEAAKAPTTNRCHICNRRLSASKH